MERMLSKIDVCHGSFVTVAFASTNVVLAVFEALSSIHLYVGHVIVAFADENDEFSTLVPKLRERSA